MRLGLPLAMLLSFVAVSHSSHAANTSAPATLVADWQTGVMSKPSGEFGYCVSEAQYSNGLSLVLALNGTRALNIGIAQKGAALPVGGERTSNIMVDNQPARPLPARVAKPEMYVINAESQPDMLKVLAAGRVVTIDGNSFSLNKTGAALATLQECVQTSMAAALPQQQPKAAPAPAAAPQLANDWQVNPQQQPAAAASVQSTVQGNLNIPATTDLPPPQKAENALQMARQPLPETKILIPNQNNTATSAAPATADMTVASTITAIEAEQSQPAPAPVAPQPPLSTLPAPLQALLVKAGLENVRATAPAQGDNFAWQSGNVHGAIVETNAVDTKNLPALAAEAMTQNSTQCYGQFTRNIGKVETTSVGQILPALAACKTDGEKKVVSYMFVRSQTGILSIMRHEGQNQRQLEKIQLGLAKALKN